MIRALRDARPLGGHAPIDVTIADGVITGIHPAGTVAAGEGVVDLEGRFLLPGLWDEHVHLTQRQVAPVQVGGVQHTTGATVDQARYREGEPERPQPGGLENGQVSGGVEHRPEKGSGRGRSPGVPATPP